MLRGEQLLVLLFTELRPHERVAAKVVARATDQAEALSAAVGAVWLHATLLGAWARSCQALM